MALPRKLKQFMVFHNGLSYLGEAEEVTLPKLKRKMEAYQGAGMLGPVKLDYGMDALEMEWKAGGFLATALSQFGAQSVDAVRFRFSGALTSDDALVAPSAVEIVVEGRYEEIDMGNAKGGEKTQHTYKMPLSYYKLTMDGQDLIELDMVNGVEIIGGDDLSAALRVLLGLL